MENLDEIDWLVGTGPSAGGSIQRFSGGQPTALIVDIDREPSPEYSDSILNGGASTFFGTTEFDPIALWHDPDVLELVMGKDTVVNVKRIRSKHFEGIVFYWRGEGLSPGGDTVEVSLSASDREIFGTVRSRRDEYRLLTMPGGRKSVYRVDLRKLQPVRNDVLAGPKRMVDDRSAKELRSPEKTAIPEVRVLCAVSQDYNLGYSGTYGYALCVGLVQVTQQAFWDSGVDVTLTVTGMPAYFYRLGGEFYGELMYVKALPHVLSKRDDVEADIVMIIAPQTNPMVCGLAFLNPAPEDAYAIAAFPANCDHIFEHEMAHLFSADHNPENISTPLSKNYARGHYFSFSEEGHTYGFSTIMTYPTVHPCHLTNYSCEHLRLFSTPTQTHPESGQPIGRVDRNNVRAINEEAQRIAAFR